MKRFFRWGALIWAAVLALSLAVPVEAGAPSIGLTILFTHDTHDYFLPDAAGVGGYTRLASLLKEQRQTPAQVRGGGEALYPVVTLDGGDFSMGSLIQTIYASDAPELRALGAMGYDAATLGNHEFDFRAQGLAEMLAAAKRSGEPLPALVMANYRTAKDAGAEVAVEAMERYPVTDYVILNRSADGTGEPLRVAVFGLMGVDSDVCAPMSGMELEPPIDAAKRVVAEIREKEKPDFVICLSHSGTEGGKGEDYELAKAVDGIDVIISGHTHTTLVEPIQVNQTLIVSCGCYTQNLGRITVTKEEGAEGVSLEEYQLLPVDGDIPEDAEMVQRTEEFQRLVNETYLSAYGLDYDQVLASAGEEFSIAQTGDLIGKAYIAAIEQAEGEQYIPVDFAVIPSGVIRDSIHKGEVTTADAFHILSLGSGADGSPGYPLASVWLTGRDLKNVFEVDASISALMPAAELSGAGAYWEYNPRRMFLDRVTVCSSGGAAVENDRLYRVAADLYTGQMLSAVKGKSFGLLSITPRDRDGEVIDNLEDFVLQDENGKELKAWLALAAYLKEAKEEIIPGPESSRAVPSWNPIRLLWPLGMPTAVLLAGVLIVAGLVVWAVRAGKRRRR